MKVLKREDTSNWKYEHTCGECDSVLELSADDVKHTHYEADPREPGSSYDTYYAFCAVCSKQFNIPEGKLTKAVKLKAKNNKPASYGGYYDR